jgi:hypothetical protein
MSGATTTEHESVETVPLQPVSPPPGSSPPISSPPISPSPSTAAAALATPLTVERVTGEQVTAEQSAPKDSRQTAANKSPQRNALPIRSQLSEQVSWRALGCPRETGIYAASGLESDEGNLKVNVKRIHILAAEDDPAALFTVVAFRPPLGPPVYTLGHRVA